MKLIALILVMMFSLPAFAEEEQVVRAGFGKGCLLTKTLNVDELKDYAGIVFRGKFLGAEYKESNGLNVRELSFEVTDPIKGISQNQKNIKLKEWANFESPFSNNSVEKNQDYVFFFHQPSPRDLTSLVGLDQGLVTINERNDVHFSKRLSMKTKPSFAAKLFNTAATGQDANITTYTELKNFFQ